ncbi:hypothetical protein AB0J86_11940 [Micromonospora sp. NPDC049559]|uniref:hypothetical protein n=1 Tax=Micromonospora sp. NPDC049559 TaxID=3155923 RepID=UPI003426D927
MRLPRTAASWTMAGFGIIALGMGIVGLVRPEALLNLLGFQVLAADQRAAGDHTRTFMAASSMASLNMGVYYLVAAATDWRPFHLFSVFFRLLTFTVFTTLVVTEVAPDRFFGVALWEGIGAVATGAGLWFDRRRGVGATPAGIVAAKA